MITPQDLRIGNLVKYNGEFYAIKSFDEEHVVLKDNVLAEYYLDYIGYDEIEAIEITEEWLLKLGVFIVETCKSFEASFPNFRFSLHKSENYDGWLFCENETVITDKIHYVNQLQNLFFALAGKELEIK